MSPSRRMLQNFEPPAWASYSARAARLAGSPELTRARCVDPVGFKAVFSRAERRAAYRFRRGRPALSFGIGRGRRGLHGFRTFLLSTSTCQTRRAGVQSNLYLRVGRCS